MRIITLLALVFLALPASAQDWDCNDPGSLPQQGMNWCAALDFKEADRALNVAWGLVDAYVKAADADTPEQWRGWPDRLLDAQRAWITFRDAHCETEGFKYRGGSIEPLIVSTCKTDLTRQRTQDLLLLMEDG